jgi:peptidoglycan hydrolase-like protein with peptidoglycan-binding domain
MKNIYKIIVGIFMFVMFSMANTAFADNDWNRVLRRGLSGDDVKVLQAILAADENIYANALFDGKFGPITENAVIKFQAKAKIGSDGIVGPITILKLKEMKGDTEIDLEDDEDNSGKRPCIIVPPGHLIAPGWLRKNLSNRPIVPVCQKLPSGISKKVDDDRPTVPDTVAPIISVLATSNISTSSARVNWKTNESTTGKVYWSTNSPVVTDTALVSSDNSLDKNHSVIINGLSANMKYYFVIKARDSSGNETTSAEQSFTTRINGEDDSEPTISSITVSGLGAVVASIHWDTDEYATSKIYYSAISPIDLGTALVASNLSLSYGHEILLAGLATNTTYYFIVESRDSSGNTARSSEQHFTTF